MSSLEALLDGLRARLAESSQTDCTTPVHAVISNWKGTPHRQAKLIGKIKKRLDADPSIDINARNRDGATALHCLVNRRLNATARFLMERGADPLLTDNDGESPLTVAAKGIEGQQGVGTAMFLVWALAHVRCSGDDRGRAVDRLLNEHTLHRGNPKADASPSLVELAVTSKHDTEGFLALLLKCGALPNGMPGAKRTPLHLAVDARKPACALLLMDHGADVNAVSPADGATPLHLAVINEDAAMVLILLRRGADPSVRMASSVGSGNPAWCDKDASDLANNKKDHMLADTLRMWKSLAASQ
ncbi:Ankyrin repeat domain containing protein [Pandoravirus salinus]|uniref:Ankyrin repeat domain containing protein n=1 Tax=Pandoravirus salinus TaxID=1349410 RepID=S4VZG6_9VIRU|nr:ankyrin repeat domain [Pandoravirus salinus]AGO85763.1 Ankyrin repeat domain containing protein [Pandoravirus salinus]